MAEPVEVIRSELLASVPHGFLGRRGGISEGVVAGLDTGLVGRHHDERLGVGQCADDVGGLPADRRRAARAVGMTRAAPSARYCAPADRSHRAGRALPCAAPSGNRRAAAPDNRRWPRPDLNSNDAPTTRLSRTGPSVTPTSSAQLQTENHGLRVGDEIVHPTFGEGIIIDIRGQGEKAEAAIRFRLVGEKHLSLAWAPLKKSGQ